MWINCDDQGRISGDPDEIKYATCPNIDDITKTDISKLLNELEKQEVIKVYATSKTMAIQMLDWWEEQRLQWAYPSKYPPPEGWIDHLRYHPTPKEIITENWPPTAGLASELLPSKLPSKPANALASNSQTPSSGEQLAKEIRAELIRLPSAIDNLAEHEAAKQKLAEMGKQRGFLVKSEVTTPAGRIDLLWEDRGEAVAAFEIDIYEPRAKSLTKLTALGCLQSFVILRTNPAPLQLEQGILLIGLGKERESKKEKETEKEKEKEKEGGKGRLPSALGSRSPPSPATQIEIYDKFIECFEKGWGFKTTGKVLAQIRDFSQELSAAGCPIPYVQEAFREAAGANKLHLVYVRGILLDWIGIERGRGPP